MVRGLRNCTSAVNWSEERNSSGARRYRRTCSLCRLGKRQKEFAATNLQAESYLAREHNARRTAPGVVHATNGITANILTVLFAQQHSRVRSAQSLQSARGK